MSSESPLRIKLSALLMAVTIALCIFTRHVSILWRRLVIRFQNSIFPSHIAAHYQITDRSRGSCDFHVEN